MALGSTSSGWTGSEKAAVIAASGLGLVVIVLLMYTLTLRYYMRKHVDPIVQKMVQRSSTIYAMLAPPGDVPASEEFTAASAVLQRMVSPDRKAAASSWGLNAHTPGVTVVGTAPAADRARRDESTSPNREIENKIAEIATGSLTPAPGATNVVSESRAWEVANPTAIAGEFDQTDQQRVWAALQASESEAQQRYLETGASGGGEDVGYIDGETLQEENAARAGYFDPHSQPGSAYDGSPSRTPTGTAVSKAMWWPN